MTVTVKYSPRKQIIIHELVPYDNVEEMLNEITMSMPEGAQLAPFRWVGGIVLFFSSLPPDTDTLAKERINGIIHWDSVIFAQMEKFEPIVRHEGRIFHVTNVSRNETFTKIGMFLHKQLNPSKNTRKPKN